MSSKYILLANLRSLYGNYDKASKAIGIKLSTIYNWSAGHSDPHLDHLTSISINTQINASHWIEENLISFKHTIRFSQSFPPNYYLKMSIRNLLVSTGKRRRDLVLGYYDGTDIMSPDTFDDYLSGKITAIPLYRLDQLGHFFNCPAHKLIEVTLNEEKGECRKLLE